MAKIYGPLVVAGVAFSVALLLLFKPAEFFSSSLPSSSTLAEDADVSVGPAATSSAAASARTEFSSADLDKSIRDRVVASTTVTASRFSRTIDNFGRKLHESSSHQLLADNGLLHQRNETCCLTRYLTSAKIPKKYGLTNVLLFAASMLAYAGLDNRAVVFPEKSPVDLELLLDFGRTEALLAPLNVRLAFRHDVQNVTKRLNWKRALKKVSGWRVGIHLGYRALSGSNDAANASTALSKLKMNMGITREAEVVSYGDFFLRFPFYAIRPLDDCFYLRRMVFSETVLSGAMRIVQHLHHKLKIRRLLALHLRLEPDARLLDKQLGRVSAVELSRFLREIISPMVVNESIDGVYICSGPLDEDYRKALRSFSQTTTPRVAVVSKDDVPGMAADLKDMAGQTTSHFAAAVDLVVMEHATIAVSTSLSTFMLAVLSRRCPSPQVPVDVRRYTTTDTLLFRTTVKRGRPGESVGVIFPPTPTAGSGLVAFEGAFSYDISNGDGGTTTMSGLTFVGCNVPWKNHCFFGNASR